MADTPSNMLQSLLEEMVLAGAGVLLIVIAVTTSVPVTAVVSGCIGALLFAAAFVSFRVKFPAAERVSGTIERYEDDDASEEGSEDEAYDEHGMTEEEPVERPAFQRRAQPRTQWEQEPEPLPAPRPSALEEERYREPFEPVQTERPARQRSAPAKSATTVPAAQLFEEQRTPAMHQAEPQSEFNNLLLKSLQIIKEVCFAHSVTFFWVKAETKQLVLEAKVSDTDAFTPDRKITMGADVVSAIAQNGEPQIVNNIQPDTERDVLCYYRNLQEIRSFIGVPVYYAGDTSQPPIAVIAADSKATDAYGDETFAILAQMSKLISSMLISYTEKYDLFADVKLIEADGNLKKRIANHPSVSAVANALTGELENIVPWESITMVLFDESQQTWGVASVRVRGNDRFVSPKQSIDLDGSIVGQTIRTNTLQTVDLSRNDGMVFNDNERSSEVLKNGTMVVAPISSGGKCFGAVAVSDRKGNAYSKKDIAAIQYLAATVAPEFEIAEMSAIMNEHLAVDELTGTLSRKMFSARLSEELFRATERDEDLSLVMVNLSNLPEIRQRYDEDGRDAALVHVARHLRASVRPYDIVARFDEGTFAIALADTIANDAFLWAEKLRTAIAGSIVTVGRKSFSTAVTIGISGASSKMTGDELVKNASHVLDLAKKAGGNIVRVF